MFSIRKNCVYGLLVLAAGCTQATQNAPQKMSAAPILQDEAMAVRQWPQLRSYYANGSSIAYPTLYPLVPARDVPDGAALVTGPALFLGQTALVPVTIFITPPWQETVYRGVNVPPSYTAVPVVEDDAAGYRPLKFKVPAPRKR